MLVTGSERRVGNRGLKMPIAIRHLLLVAAAIALVAAPLITAWMLR